LKAGYDIGDPDGIIGPKTIDAISAFQIKQGISPNGKADQDLLTLLKKKVRKNTSRN
ncbi:MAG: peptidoglycan-binding protein, partial [Rhodobacteraceae bacterium]|nr:peptidoglycan-binding protein [Paracoccaceae bacterium]